MINILEVQIGLSLGGAVPGFLDPDWAKSFKKAEAGDAHTLGTAESCAIRVPYSIHLIIFHRRAAAISLSPVV